jgi:hypothetical protein
MNRLFSAKPLVASAIALGAIVAGTAAHASTDVRLVVDLNTPHRYVQPAPVYVQPQAVQYRHDGDRFDRFNRNDRVVRGGPMGDADRDGIPNRFDRDSRAYDARATYRHAQWGDFDRDGVPNQFDRAPRNPRRY